LREQILHGGGPEWLDMDLDNLGGNGVGAGALPPVAAGGVGGFLFGAAGENTAMKIAFLFFCF
jgi:hypothetical protein